MAATPKPKFMMLGKSKWVHVVRTETWDRKNSQCQQVRKFVVAGKVPKGKGLSLEAASALDPCPNCDTAGVIKEVTPPEQRKEQAKAKRDDTMAKIADSKKTAGQRKKEAKQKDKSAKAPKAKKAGKAKGPRSIGADSTDKANALAAFAKEHGWEASVTDANPGLLVEADRQGETIRCWFVDGKYDTTRHAQLIVGTWTGKLRGVHGCRKQMANEGRDRPHPNPGAGRSVAKRKAADEVVPEDESPEDALRRVPFSVDDDPLEIIDKLLGKTIKWRNGVSGSVEEAWLPAMVRPVRAARKAKRDVITITEHPKTGRRMVTFLTVLAITEHGEQYGPERSVYLDKIVRVVG